MIDEAHEQILMYVDISVSFQIFWRIPEFYEGLFILTYL